ncbi:unnamed protein product [Vitrella brassicaformis CCMP3155]|uniref:DNA polymerase II subunit 2 n=2 Tax=Vitrella brassicaformis TaxID=1169539 RepID=A0A0G4G267_VITBC|nr:unnamed protein product [Vitrella brassicaformis CCMP3155]|eukprot:CEM21842.1 unnamed protein product [Vitrella brassicaformis CCMP3155]
MDEDDPFADLDDVFNDQSSQAPPPPQQQQQQSQRAADGDGDGEGRDERERRQKLQRDICRAIGQLGFQLRPQAANQICAAVRAATDEEREQMLQRFIEKLQAYVQRRRLQSSTIDEAVAREILQQCVGSSDVGSFRELTAHLPKDCLAVINLYRDVVKHQFDSGTRTFVPARRPPSLCSAADNRNQLFRDRYNLIKYRLGRDERFRDAMEVERRGLLRASGADPSLVLTPVEGLLGNPGRKLTYGFLTRLEEDRFFLEDPHRNIPLNLDRAHSIGGYIMEESFVLAEGEVHNGVLHVGALSLPPAESCANCPREPNLFGAKVSKADRELMRELDARCPAHMRGIFVVCSEVHLDREETFCRLHNLCKGFVISGGIPTGFILMGNFSSQPFFRTAACVRAYRGGFEKLRELMQAFPQLTENTRWIIVPGPSDPGCDVLPRPPLAEYLTDYLRMHFPDSVEMATNPCRVRHFHREIVVFRQNLHRLLHRFALFANLDPGAKDKDRHMEVVRTLADSGHVCPVPLKVRSVVWDFDYTLALYPMPHTVLLGDMTSPFQTTYEGTLFCNTGQFTRDGVFFLYRPGHASGEMDESFVSDEDIDMDTLHEGAGEGAGQGEEEGEQQDNGGGENDTMQQ